ncbi:MAG: NYN domain-containing protein [Candidatus Pacebacteria bacterium]|nr:NYN domain-containing protein [Candidatus Paceibacterota bacterium]
MCIKEVNDYKDMKRIEVKCPFCEKDFIKRYWAKKSKGNCDAELTLDIIRFGVRKRYKGIIVFSGDGDFARVYEYVSKELRKKVIIYAPKKKRTSVKLKKLFEQKIITLEGLNPLFPYYGKKN